LICFWFRHLEEQGRDAEQGADARRGNDKGGQEKRGGRRAPATSRLSDERGAGPAQNCKILSCPHEGEEGEGKQYRETRQ